MTPFSVCLASPVSLQAKILIRSLPVLGLCFREQYRWKGHASFWESIPDSVLEYRVASGVAKPPILRK